MFSKENVQLDDGPCVDTHLLLYSKATTVVYQVYSYVAPYEEDVQ